MSGFHDRRLIENDKAIVEMNAMDARIADYAQEYGLSGHNVPKVIGASDQDAWVKTQYLVAWGCELASWQEREPRNYTIHYPSTCDPLDLGALHQFNFLEGKRVGASDIKRIAITIGRHREMVQQGVEPRSNPLWSFAASTFAKAVVLDQLQKFGKLDLKSRNIEMDGPVINLSSWTDWRQSLQCIDNGLISIYGNLTLPQSASMGIERYEGKPLSHLIAGKSYEGIIIRDIVLTQDWDDEGSDDYNLTITIQGKIERLRDAPEGVANDNPIDAWLQLAQG